MASLSVNYEQLDTLSSNVLARGNEFAELLSQIKGYNATLQEVWAGTDASAYTEKVTMQAEQIQKLVDSITEIGNFLQKVSNSYSEMQNKITSTINSN